MFEPIASLSLDLDNKWSYMKTHGDPGWEAFPSYLDVAVPQILRLLEARGLTLTCFIVGQDAARAENEEALCAIAEAGHEIGNHSFAHEPWLHLYTRSEIEADIDRAETHIFQATGKRPVGFRGPGFSLSATTLSVLAERGYRYDASTFPTYLGPLARAYYFMKADLESREKDQRNMLFGRFRDGFQKLKPYRWHLSGKTLIEIPVTTLPLFKLPMHVSYLLYAARFSPAAAMGYFKAALALCRMTHTPPSLLLHPLDFLGYDDVQGLDFFPAMNMSGNKKRDLVGAFLEVLAEHYSVVTLQAFAQRVSSEATDVRRIAPAVRETATTL